MDNGDGMLIKVPSVNEPSVVRHARTTGQATLQFKPTCLGKHVSSGIGVSMIPFLSRRTMPQPYTSRNR